MYSDYVIGFNKDGYREVSYLCEFDVSLSENTPLLKELRETAKNVDGVEIVEIVSQEDFDKYINGFKRHIDGRPIEIKNSKPALNKNETREAALRILDSEYTEKISDIELEMAKAKAIEDEELYADLKTEREELISEYAKKRSQI